jgi:hypothetical protein
MQKDGSNKAVRIGNIFGARYCAIVGIWTGGSYKGIPIADTTVVH